MYVEQRISTGLLTIWGPPVIKNLKAGDPVSVGPYKLLNRLGAGGMGEVYLAKSPGGRLVAIKLIRPELAEERGFRARFAGEIAAARGVSGIYTAAVVDADPEAELPWMATVYVPGPSLTDAVEDDGPLPVKSVLALAAGLAEALEAIHRAGLVHRDMKPSNVLLAADGPRVIDFGISRALERSMMTATGTVLGSPGFMSPEQAMGEQVGQPTDVFSLGAILAYAATGSGPFGTGPTPALLYRVVKEEPNLAQVPDRLRPLIEQCLAKDPAARPTPTALLASLGDDVEVITGEWLPQKIADGMGQYSPTLSTPLPPSLRDPDSAPVEPVGAGPAESASGTSTLPPATELAASIPPPAGARGAAAPAAAAVAAAAAAAAAASAAHASVPPPATELAAAAGPPPAPSVDATRAEYNLPETSMMGTPGGNGFSETSLVAVPSASGGLDYQAGGPAGPGGPGAPGGLAAAPAGPRRGRRRRWPVALAAAAVVVIAVVAVLALTGSHGGAPKKPASTASLAGDQASQPSTSASGSIGPTKAAHKPSASASSAPVQSATAPAYAHSSTPTATATWTPTPTATATPTTTTTTTTTTATPTTSPTTTTTTTATATPTTTATATTAPTASTQPTSPATSTP
jgi:serine/threonine protein kinase